MSPCTVVKGIIYILLLRYLAKLRFPAQRFNFWWATVVHPRRLTWNISSWRFGRSFSFPNGWFVGSMFIFQGVNPPKKLTPTLSSSKHRLEKRLQQQAANPAHEPILAVPLSSCIDMCISKHIYGYGSKNRLDRPAVIRTSGTRGLRKGAWSRGLQGPN